MTFLDLHLSACSLICCSNYKALSNTSMSILCFTAMSDWAMHFTSRTDDGHSITVRTLETSVNDNGKRSRQSHSKQKMLIFELHKQMRNFQRLVILSLKESEKVTPSEVFYSPVKLDEKTPVRLTKRQHPRFYYQSWHILFRNGQSIYRKR
jgi:hypothetical protein